MQSIHNDLRSIKTDVLSLKTEVLSLRQDVLAMKQDILTMKTNETELRRNAAIEFNRKYAGRRGSGIEPRVVPNKGGEMPTDEMIKLMNPNTLATLPEDKLAECLAFYGLTSQIPDGPSQIPNGPSSSQIPDGLRGKKEERVEEMRAILADELGFPFWCCD